MVIVNTIRLYDNFESQSYEQHHYNSLSGSNLNLAEHVRRNFYGTVVRQEYSEHTRRISKGIFYFFLHHLPSYLLMFPCDKKLFLHHVNARIHY
jgi:hypothetical protein